MLRIAICDDSKIDITVLREFVNEYISKRELECDLRVFNHPDTLLQECESFRPHIYILDIIMPMVTGIEVARELRWNQKESQIIFTTSDPSFALEAFDVNPINYLVKPLEKKKLFDTLDMSLRRVEFEESKTVNIKVRGGYETVDIKNILYLDYRNHVVTYHMNDGDEISTSTLRIGFVEYLRTNLEGMGFVQCHESIAVRLEAISGLSRDTITLRNKEMLPVSKSRYKSVEEAYLKNN